jgi:hypothetical protein
MIDHELPVQGRAECPGRSPVPLPGPPAVQPGVHHLFPVEFDQAVGGERAGPAVAAC